VSHTVTLVSCSFSRGAPSPVPRICCICCIYRLCYILSAIQPKLATCYKPGLDPPNDPTFEGEEREAKRKINRFNNTTHWRDRTGRTWRLCPNSTMPGPCLDKTTRIPQTPKQEDVPTPPATFQTIGTYAPATTQNIDSNKRTSFKETSPRFAKADFLKHLKAAAQI
jgi:hypothetical protein